MQMQAMASTFEQQLAASEEKSASSSASKKDKKKDDKKKEKALEEKVKTLEYKNKQTEMNIEALQQTLAAEAEKKQEIQDESREKDDKINDYSHGM